MANIIRLTNSATIIEPSAKRPKLVVDRGERVEIPLRGGELADFKLMGLAEGATHAELASGGAFTALAHNVIALRVGSDLVLEYADGTQIVLKGFFAPNVGAEASGGEGFTVELSAPRSTTISISSTSTGKKLSATSELIALRGDEIALKQLAYDNFALRSEIATVFANANTPVGDSLVWSAVKDGAQSLAGAGLGASNAAPIALGVGALAAGAASSKSNNSSKITFSITSDPGSDDSYNVNDVIQITVNSPQAATVTGVPTLTLMIGTGTRSASYVAADSTANKLVFEYTVQGGDWDTDGISIPQNSITLPTGVTIVNAQDTAIDFSHSAIASDSGHKVEPPAYPVTATSAQNTLAGTDGRRDVFRWDANTQGVEDTITNFDVADGDHIDVSAIISGFTTGATASDWITVYRAEGADTKITIDLDGGGSGTVTQQISLSGVDLLGSAANAAALVTSGLVILG